VKIGSGNSKASKIRAVVQAPMGKPVRINSGFSLPPSVPFLLACPTQVFLVAIGASFKQFEKSNGGACTSLLDYRPLSHNQALEIDRLKHVLVESKGLAEIERIANLAASTVIRMSADCVPLRSLAAATPNSVHSSKPNDLGLCAPQHS
jgi:hypothetical protein